MFDWSKDMIKKISESGCLKEDEIRAVEVALRSYDALNHILNECIGISETNTYELEHKMNLIRGGK